MFDVPVRLSPSRVEAFTSCPMAFRFASIEKLPEPPGIHMTRGSLVHRALELFFMLPARDRTPARLDTALESALAEYRTDPEFTFLGLGTDEIIEFERECHELIGNYLRMEDPTAVREIGLELRLSAQVDALTLNGIIDRLELDADGELIVTDYKTGRAPSVNYEQKSLAGVHFYSFLCESVFGRRPRAIRLMYLQVGRDDHRHAVGAVGQVHHHPHAGRVEGGRARLPDGRLPAAARPALQRMRVPGVVPGVRWRPRTGRRRGHGALRAAGARVTAGAGARPGQSRPRRRTLRPARRSSCSRSFAAIRSSTACSPPPAVSATSA